MYNFEYSSDMNYRQDWETSSNDSSPREFQDVSGPNGLDAETVASRWARCGQPLFPFWGDQPVEWFEHAERIFDVMKIESDENRIKHVMESLDAEAMSIVLDLIDDYDAHPPRYDQLKSCLIATYSNWSEQPRTKLNSPKNQKQQQQQKQYSSSGRMMPSMSLRQLIATLSPELILNDPEGLRSVWLDQLDPVVRVASAEMTERLDNVAEFADRVMTVYDQQQQRVHSKILKSFKSLEENISMVDYHVVETFLQQAEVSDTCKKMFDVLNTIAAKISAIFEEKTAQAQENRVEKAAVEGKEAVEEKAAVVEKVAVEEKATGEGTTTSATFAEKAAVAQNETAGGKFMTFAEKAAMAKKETAVEMSKTDDEDKAVVTKKETAVLKTKIKFSAAEFVAKNSTLCYYHEEFGARARNCRGGLCPYGKEAK